MDQPTPPNEVQLCVLCGIAPATKGDGDHLPPQCIYPRPRTPGLELHKVPACIPCNANGSKDDEVFKLVIGLSTGEYRLGEKKLIDSLAKTMAGNKKLARKTLSSARQTWAQDLETGIFHKRIALNFDHSAYERVIQRIIKGLFWRETGRIMSQRQVHVMHGDQPQGPLVQQIKSLLRQLDPKSLNGGEFTYKCYLSDDGQSFWALQFFKKHTVFAFTDADL